MASLKSLAAAANQSPAAFAKGNIHTDGLVGKLARIYYFSTGVHGGGAASMETAGDKPRTPGERLYQVG
jgi:hypothetical protein